MNVYSIYLLLSVDLSVYPFQWDGKEYLSNHVVVLLGVLDVPTGTDTSFVVSS